jgi:glycosyltransferase involved in cell wall biosynthesis
MKISFAITVHNEGEYIMKLLDVIFGFTQDHIEKYEIVILDDNSDDPLTKYVLEYYGRSVVSKVKQRKFTGNFSDHKNYLNSLCSGDYIFQIDADEYPSKLLLSSLESIIESNPEVDLFYVPRVNIVNGLTNSHINRWNWKVNDKGYVMWPDYQGRIYRNSPNISWVNPVHEMITGFKTCSFLPDQEEYALMHVKDIERQEKQNDLYNEIQYARKV